MRGVICAAALGLLALPCAAHADPLYQKKLLGEANVTIAGGATYDSVGVNVSDGGDVNGDGRADVLVASDWASNNTRAQSGSVWVVYGQATQTNVNLASINGASALGYRIDGASANDRAGTSVRNAGDLDGDGKADQLIGAYWTDYNGTDSGSAYVLFGKSGGGARVDLATITASQGYRIDGAVAGDWTGANVVNAGDVNKDGVNDQLVSAEYADGGASYSGVAYLVYGKTKATAARVNLAQPMGSNGYRMLGASADQLAGARIANAGDVNGDGRPDHMVAASYADYGGTDTGSVYIVFGRSGPGDVTLGAANSGYRIDGAAAGDIVGFSVDGVGDVNGDSIPDQVIGSREATNNGRLNAGAAYVVFGKSSTSNVALSSFTGSSSQGFRIDGAVADDAAGYSVAGLGDVNGDGRGDVAVGAPDADRPLASKAGAAYVVFGAPGAAGNVDLLNPGTRGYVTWGSTADELVGFSVSNAGDANGDGRNDVLIGAPGVDGSVEDGGAAYIVNSDATAPTMALSYSATGGADGQLFDAANSRLFYNPKLGDGSFKLSTAPADSGSGPVAVDYTAATATGFTGAASQAIASPWSSGTYAYTTSNQTSPGAITATTSDGQGNRTSKALTLIRDASVPAPSLAAVPARFKDNQPLSATASDGEAGMASVAFRYCPGTTCAWTAGTALGAADTVAPYTSTWSAGQPDGTYTIVARSTDKVGNTNDATRTVTLDNTGPTQAKLTTSAVSGSANQHFDQTTQTLWYSPSAPGSFKVTATATDLARADFPQLTGDDFSGSTLSAVTSPFSSATYSFGTTNTTAPAPRTVQLFDGLGNASATTLKFARDMAAPTGGSITYPDGDRGATPVPVSVDPGSDTGAGIAPGSGRIERDSAPLAGSACGAFEDSWTTVAASDGGAAAGRCYRYRYRATDRVGNETVYTSSSTVRRPQPATPVPPGGQGGGSSASPGNPGTPGGGGSHGGGSHGGGSDDGDAGEGDGFVATPDPLKRPLRISIGKIGIDSRGRARVKVRCDSTRTCRGRFQLFYYEKVRRPRKAKGAIASVAARARRKKVVVAKGRVNVKAKSSGTVTVRISRHSRRKLLRRKKRRRCKISTVVNGRKATKSVTVSAKRRR